MKATIILAIIALLTLNASAQIEPGVYVSGSAGINSSRQSIISAGLHANLNHFYAGVNATPNLNGATIVEARAGVILGSSVSAVPYIGYGVQMLPKQFDDYGIKSSTSSSKHALTYGMMLTAPTAWDKTRFLLSFQFFDGKPSVAAGIKLQLSNSTPCNR